MTTIKAIRIRETVRPLRMRFATAQGGKSMLKSVMVTVVLEDGLTGTGECPTSLSLKTESVQETKRFLSMVIPRLCGAPIDEYESFVAKLRKQYPQFPMTISGLEVALFRAYLACHGRSEHDYWGGKARTVETDITIPLADDVGIIRHWLHYAIRKGFSTYKLKVSGDVERDKKMLSFVYEVLSRSLDTFTLRLDGNQGFTVRTYAGFTEFIQKAGYKVELIEQPLPRDDLQGIKEVRRFSPFPIILDETVLTGSDAQRVADENLAHGINIKIAKSGIGESQSIIRVAREFGLKLMIGCMVETMIGLSAAVCLAVGTDAFEYVDLDAVFFLYHKGHHKEISIEGPCFILSP